MDSGNSSSSLQSSNGGGGDESSSFSAFLNNNPSPQTPTPFSISTNHNMFDTLSSYLDPTQPSSSSLLNLDMMWSKNHRSEPNPTHLPCSSPSLHNQEASLSREASFYAFHSNNTNLLTQGSGSSRGLVSSVSAAINNDQGHNMVRNPKKRSRASRRAPTTVLTTDTTNFRAMVQEFTGIPAPPFTSHFPRTRLNLFAPLHRASSTIPSSSTLLDPSFLLRPFAQKFQQHPFPPSTLLLGSNNNSTNSTSITYPHNFNNMHNNNLNILNFQNTNTLQQPPQQQPSLEIPQQSDGYLKMGVLEEIGLRHADVNNNNTNISGLHHQKIQNMVPSGNNNMSANASSMDQWPHKTDTVLTNGKVQHFSSASSLSDFHGEKLPRSTTTVAAAARSEGMVESWTNCSSH
ncbi:hypothetical protein TanjilG_31341 [Lupinus angustifolius]|uniref:VQ domain-containing protein n=1 Tax=Lupinus angustifolius TaxID=3871 RepID=A0A4P1RTM1_LUPAN|nr:hypothetical protein TanjilG_31341 [Lupinus angustifolius]